MHSWQIVLSALCSDHFTDISHSTQLPDTWRFLYYDKIASLLFVCHDQNSQMFWVLTVNTNNLTETLSLKMGILRIFQCRFKALIYSLKCSRQHPLRCSGNWEISSNRKRKIRNGLPKTLWRWRRLRCRMHIPWGTVCRLISGECGRRRMDLCPLRLYRHPNSMRIFSELLGWGSFDCDRLLFFCVFVLLKCRFV